MSPSRPVASAPTCACRSRTRDPRRSSSTPPPPNDAPEKPTPSGVGPQPLLSAHPSRELRDALLRLRSVRVPALLGLERHPPVVPVVLQHAPELRDGQLAVADQLGDAAPLRAVGVGHAVRVLEVHVLEEPPQRRVRLVRRFLLPPR